MDTPKSSKIAHLHFRTSENSRYIVEEQRGRNKETRGPERFVFQWDCVPKGMKGSLLALCFSVGDYRPAMLRSTSRDLSRNRQTFRIRSAFLPISRVTERWVNDSIHFVTSNRKSWDDEISDQVKCVIEAIYDLIKVIVMFGPRAAVWW